MNRHDYLNTFGKFDPDDLSAMERRCAEIVGMPPDSLLYNQHFAVRAFPKLHLKVYRRSGHSPVKSAKARKRKAQRYAVGYIFCWYGDFETYSYPTTGRSSKDEPDWQELPRSK